MKTYNKLIRDFIPAVLDKEKIGYESYIAGEKEYEEKLFDKLLEEVHEFIEDKNIEELGDVMEVIYTIMKLKNIKQEDIESERVKKKELKGGFDKKIILQYTK